MLLRRTISLPAALAVVAVLLWAPAAGGAAPERHPAVGGVADDGGSDGGDGHNESGETGETGGGPPGGSTGGALALGAAAGTAGFLAGFMVGQSLGDGEHEWSGLEQGYVLGSVTGGLLLPLGVHAGHGSRGNAWLVLLASAAAGAAGNLAAFASGDGHWLLATPFFQLTACTLVEIATTPEDGAAAASARAREGLVAGAVVLDGRPGLAVAARF